MAPRRILLMTEPPSIDANEITDKGYMNQRAVLERRAALVEKLYPKVPTSSLLDAEPGDGADRDQRADELRRRDGVAEEDPRESDQRDRLEVERTGARRRHLGST